MKQHPIPGAESKKSSLLTLKNYTFFLLIACVIIATSCTKECITGSGSTTSQTRDVAVFHGIEISGNKKVQVTYGLKQEVILTGYENLLNYFETNVHDGILQLKYKNNTNVKNDNIEISIVVPEFDQAFLSGSGNLSVNNFNGNSLTLTLSGSNSVYVSSTYTSASISMSGSDHVIGTNFNTKNTDAQISGSGTIELVCSDKLKAQISGSGNIYYWGNPTLDVSVSGSGKIARQQ